MVRSDFVKSVLRDNPQGFKEFSASIAYNEKYFAPSHTNLANIERLRGHIHRLVQDIKRDTKERQRQQKILSMMHANRFLNIRQKLEMKETQEKIAKLGARIERKQELGRRTVAKLATFPHTQTNHLELLPRDEFNPIGPRNLRAKPKQYKGPIKTNIY